MSTVCAIATPAAVGGISAVRISGKRAFSVAESVFKPIYPTVNVSEMSGYTAAYGKIFDDTPTDTTSNLLAIHMVRLRSPSVENFSCLGYRA